MSLKNFILIFVFILSLLILRFYTYYSNLPQFKDGQGVVVNTRIISEPEIEDKLQRFKISPKGMDIYVTSGKYPIYRYGEFLRIEGEMKVSKNDDRVFYSLSFPKISQVNKAPNFLIGLSFYVRAKAIEVYRAFLTDTQSALLLGIVFGIKQNMPDDFYEVLKDAGVVHVIAASGMNVSMAAGSLFFIFQRFFKRRTALIFSLLGVFCYVSIAGFEPSIVRAAIMAGIVYVAGITGRQRYSLYGLFLTAVIMLFIDPSWLYDLGFQLSFMATLGIILLKPIFDQILKIGGGSIKDDFGTTLAAQLATLPILLSNFGSVNLTSVIVNLLVLWTIPALMAIGAISVITGLIFTQLGSFVSVFSIPLLIYFEIVVRYFDRFKIPLEMEKTSWILWVGYYLVISAIVIYAGNKKKAKKRD